MSLIDLFLSLDRSTTGRSRPGWQPILPVLIPLLIGTAVAAALHSSALWLGALFGVVLGASVILSARERA